VRVSTLNAWDQVSGLPGWDDLVDLSGASAYSARSYVIPWWRELGTGRLCCVVAEEDDELVGLLLAYEVPLFPGRWNVRCLGHGDGAVHQVLAAPGRTDVAEALWEELLAEPRRQLRMEDLVDLPSSRPHGAHAARARTTHCRPRAVLDLADEATGDSKRDGPGPEPGGAAHIDIIRASTPGAVAQLWPQFIGQLSGHWLVESGPGGTSFALSMLDATARRGGLTIHAACRGSELVSLSICLYHGSTAALWDPVVHRHEDQVPATRPVDRLLLDDVIAEARSRGSQRLIVDGGRGPEWRPLPLVGVETTVPAQLPERISRWLHRGARQD